MNSYILKVQPMLDNSKLKQMETTLSRRFSNVARKFGSGLKNALRLGLTGGAIGASFALLSNALLNPLREADEKINAILAKAGDIKTRAAQFGINEADYFAFQASAASKGIDEGSLITILTRMQTMIGEARAGKENALIQYKDESNMVKVFIGVSKALQKITDNEKRVKIEAEIFGGKAVGRLENFIMSDIEANTWKLTKGYIKNKVNQELRRQAQLEQEQQFMATRRAVDEQINTGKKTNFQAIKQQDEAARLDNRRTAGNIERYKYLAGINNKLQELQISIAEDLTQLLDKEKREQAVKAGVDMATNPKEMLNELQKVNKEMAVISIKLSELIKRNPLSTNLETIGKKLTEISIKTKDNMGFGGN
jgi:hypothetical protein